VRAAVRGALRCLLLATLACGVAMAADPQDERAAMVRIVADDVRATADYLGTEALDERVLDALGRVPRHAFVPPERRSEAYENRPLPIGWGQTISQPYIVAVMTHLLALEPGDRVFELGTGSGYQAAILAELGAEVFTMEIIEPLGERAAETLRGQGYPQVSARVGDGYDGWPEQAPFDAVIVTAAGDHVPPPLIQQLRPGGRLVMPVGSRFLTQQLTLVEKGEDGSLTSRALLPVAFVPLTGGH
jgi:protein-L-isoaspartate(D-aspartate) O-methyltransferase